MLPKCGFLGQGGDSCDDRCGKGTHVKSQMLNQRPGLADAHRLDPAETGWERRLGRAGPESRKAKLRVAGNRNLKGGAAGVALPRPPTHPAPAPPPASRILPEAPRPFVRPPPGCCSWRERGLPRGP